MSRVSGRRAQAQFDEWAVGCPRRGVYKPQPTNRDPITPRSYFQIETSTASHRLLQCLRLGLDQQIES